MWSNPASRRLFVKGAIELGRSAKLMLNAEDRLIRVLGSAASYNDKGHYWYRHRPAQILRYQQQWQGEIDALVSEIGEKALPATLLSALRSGAAVRDDAGTYVSEARLWAVACRPRRVGNIAALFGALRAFLRSPRR